jgi:16S rRNA processing protein RimM
VTDILETGANNVFVITGPLGEQLIPDIPDVIREVDIEKGQLVISPIPGMFDDPEQKIQ